ncbi:uncharacterized protein LOC112027653 [Quercus suber]|uniref:uncharacterized protein LOC112027653 n=1 Tax=Quercus suber TaxID=58331 RepID=UPI000CE173DB|nr:uncharacterized protein LOC112027653 [Quercus suber]
MREYYAYRLQEREHEGNTFVNGGRLFQQFDVDAYTCIEEIRLMWVKHNQDKLRIELYKGLKDAVMRGDTTSASSGKIFVLPSSFTGSPRYMIENYQDAMAICRWAGYLDLFITFTCNTRWPEIDLFLSRKPGQKVEDRPDVVARVFKIKLDQLLNDLKHGQHFGKVIAVVYTVEYQKSGLPHVHILLFLHHDDKHPTAAEIVRIISAEIPDLNEETLAYEVVKQYMVHDTNEVKTYLNCRYVSAIEACWRMFEFAIHHQEPVVQRLSFHNEDKQPVVFEDTNYFNNVVDKPDIGKSKFTEWMKANALYEEARELTYSEFSTKWVWHRRDKEWKLRKSGRCIGRIYYAHPTSGEWFYLRMLLNVIKGARSFEEMRTINNVVYPTFRSTCYALGLLDDDKEWHEALNHASYWALGKQLRELFVTMLIFCEVADPYKLWTSNWQLLSEDILHHQRTVLQYDNLHLDDFQLQNYALCEIEQILIKSGRSLHEFKTIPYPNTLLLRQSNNRVLQEELDYDRNSLAAEHIKLLADLNIDQRNIYDEVIDSVSENKGGFFFVYGHGGIGKTYLWKTIICRLRLEGKIVIAIASSRIAALLLPGRRTAHSRFQIPINVTNSSTCGIKQGSQIAELMTKASLIVWDEAPMAHRNCFEAVDRSLRDILHFSNSNSGETPFGGKTIILGGDFSCKVFILTINMRLTQNPSDIAAREFAEWILKIGDGELGNSEGEELIEIPHDLLIQPGAHPFNDIVKATYPDFDTKFNNTKFLAPTNEVVEDINGYMIDLINVDEETYLSADSLCKASSNILDQDVMYPIEFLNSLKFPGIPNHKLILKVGLPIMLLRNLNQSNGLCNGTRLLVTQLSKWVLEA